MSSLAGTSWGTLATVGVACMGVAEGLGVPLEAAAGAVCVGAFFGDKLSSLSDSTVITATVTGTSLMDGIRHASITTGLTYVISLIFFFIYGLNFNIGTVETGSYAEILNTIEQYFNLNPITLLPVPIVIALIVMRKPTIPTFVGGSDVRRSVANSRCCPSAAGPLEALRSHKSLNELLCHVFTRSFLHNHGSLIC